MIFIIRYFLLTKWKIYQIFSQFLALTLVFIIYNILYFFSYKMFNDLNSF